MFRASRCRQRPSVVRAGRLGLLPKVAGVGLGWSHGGPVPAQATWATMPHSSLVSPSLRRPLSKSAGLIKTCQLCADTLLHTQRRWELIVAPVAASTFSRPSPGVGQEELHPAWSLPARSMVWPTSSGAMACSRRVSWFLDAPAGLEASSIRAAVSWIATTVGLTNVDLWR